jgi:hypothetical protein
MVRNLWPNLSKMSHALLDIENRGTLRSHHGTGIDFNKICLFCDKYYVRIDKCVFIVIKIKFVNSCRINDICDKVNFTTNYTHLLYLTYILSKYT